MSNTCASTSCRRKMISSVTKKFCKVCKCPFQGCFNHKLLCENHHCQSQDCQYFIKDSNTLYCKRHKCLNMNCNEKLKCPLHICIDSKCLFSKMPNSDYCENHKCEKIGCVQNKRTCKLHKCQIRHCVELKEDNSRYCKHHKCILCEKSNYTCKEHCCQICHQNPTVFTNVLCCHDCNCKTDGCHQPSIHRHKCEEHIERCNQKDCFEIATTHHPQFLYCKKHGRCVICKHRPQELGREICSLHTNCFERYPIQPLVKKIYYPEKLKLLFRMIRMREPIIDKNPTEYDETVLFVSSVLSKDLFIELYQNLI